MKLFLLLSILILIISQSASQDVRPLPNIQHLALGIDTLILQRIMDAIRFPILRFEYNQNKTIWLNNTQYAIPDNCYYLRLDEIEATSHNELFISSMDVQQKLYYSVSQDAGMWGLFGMASGSYEASYFNEEYQLHASYIAFSNLLIKVWKVFCEDQLYDFVFLEDLKALPNYFNSSSCPIFKKFFKRYGTHSFISAIMGGTLQMQSSYKIDYYYSVTDVKVKGDLNLQFDLKSSNVDLTQNQHQELEQLNTYYDSDMMLIGGNPNEFTPNTWRKWAETVKNKPIPLVYNLKGHFDIFNDTNSRNALRDATISFLLSKMNQMNLISAAPPSIKFNPENYHEPLSVLTVSTIFKDKIYILNYNVFARYIPKTNAWLQYPKIPVYSTSIDKQTWNAIFGYSDQQSDYIYAMAAKNNYDPLYRQKLVNGIARFDLKTQVWTWILDYPKNIAGISFFSVAEYKGKIYTFGGCIYSMKYCSVTASILMYDPVSNTISEYGRMSDLRLYVMTVPVNSRIYLIGGQNPWYNQGTHDHILNSVISFDIESKTWSTHASLPVPIYKGMAYYDSLHNTIVVVGGITNNGQRGGAISSYVQTYNINTNSWSIEKIALLSSAYTTVGGLIEDRLEYVISANSFSGLTQTMVRSITNFC